MIHNRCQAGIEPKHCIVHKAGGMHVMTYYNTYVSLTGLEYLEALVIYKISDIVYVVGHAFNYSLV